MSADRQRLKSAIQRIAKEDPEIRNLLGEGKNKGGKASSAGVGTSEAEESRLCCDGSTSSNANPGTEERDPDADGAGQEGLDSDDPADLSSGDGTLSGVTDCATGEPVCFDGAGFIPPDGWDDPRSPPVDDAYEEGTYFIATVATKTAYGLTPCIAVERGFAANGESISSCNETGFASVEYCQIDEGSGEEACFLKDVSYDYCAEVFRDVCNDPIPMADAWPSDGCTNLAVKDGKIVGSKYDPDQDGSYSAPRDSIDLCSGGDQISLAPSADGGWKTINSTTNNGYLYDSSGRQIAHIDGNEYSDPNV